MFIKFLTIYCPVDFNKLGGRG